MVFTIESIAIWRATSASPTLRTSYVSTTTALRLSLPIASDSVHFAFGDTITFQNPLGERVSSAASAVPSSSIMEK
jgi:hypothetical protein